MNQRFETAAVAVFIAMVLDGMDGRVARMTHSQSAFGANSTTSPTWSALAWRQR